MSRDTTIPGRLGIWAICRLAWRNLARNRRRTWITATTVSGAILLLQFMSAMMLGLEEQSFDNLIYYQTGHAKLFAEGYYDEREELTLDYTLSELELLQEKIQEVRGVAASTPRLVFSAMISDGIDQTPVVGTGIDLEGSDTDVFRLPQAVVDGRFFESGEEGILLGSGLAKFFGVATGDWLTILAKTKTGAYEALDMPVVGVVGTGNPVIDQNSFMIPLRTARNMLGMEGEATELAIRFQAGFSEKAVQERLQNEIADTDGVEVKSWREVEDNFMALVQAKRSGSTVAMGIFVIVAIVGITNTILMASFERTREIGMLMAMGLRRSGVRYLFLTEGAMIGLLGGAVGTLIALIFIFYFAANGIDLTALYGDMDIGYPVKDVLYLAVSTTNIVVTWLTTGVLAALASVYPAVRASKQDPAEAIRYV